MEFINIIINQINGVLWGYVLIYLLLGAGIIFTIRTKFGQVVLLKEMFRVISDTKPSIGPDGKKGISGFGAFMIGAATRIGTGNLAGVTTAVAFGGPGAIFWMWLVALVGGATSMIECTLAQLYKEKDEQTGTFKGGPAYYIQKALGQRWLAVAMAIFTILSFAWIFNSVQANTIADSLDNSFNISPSVTGILLVILSGIVIFGGIHRISRFSATVVPIMAGIYILLGLYVFVTNIAMIPTVFMLIFKSAFGLEQAFAGGMGAALSFGVKRGLFSNEAGMGSAPNAAAAATVSHPVKQGLIQTLGVYFDTLIVCSITAFVILLSDVYNISETYEGVSLLQQSMSSHIGTWASGFMAISIFLFAFSSIIGSYYYGEMNMKLIKDNKRTITVFRLITLGFVLFGSLVSVATVWNLADVCMALMTITNVSVILVISPTALRLIQNYIQQLKQQKDPVFYLDDLPELNSAQITAWPKNSDQQSDSMWHPTNKSS